MLATQFHERFWNKVDRKGEDECWLWTASQAGNGYGQFKLPGTRRNAYAHRVAYSIAKGAIPPRKQVLHSCDTRLCCNPKHLSAGSSRDNALDMVRKGRSLWGEKNPQSKLNVNRVRAIRHLAASTDMTNAEIALLFGLHRGTVSRIVNGARWGSLKE